MEPCRGFTNTWHWVPMAQDVANWKAIRATSYIYPDMPITNEQAVHFQELGLKFLHTNTGCSDYTLASLKRDFRDELARFAELSRRGGSATNRSHCPQLERLVIHSESRALAQYPPRCHLLLLARGLDAQPARHVYRLGIPHALCRYGRIPIDVYQLPTQMTDETNMNYAAFCNEVSTARWDPKDTTGLLRQYAYRSSEKRRSGSHHRFGGCPRCSRHLGPATAHLGSTRATLLPAAICPGRRTNCSLPLPRIPKLFTSR